MAWKILDKIDAQSLLDARAALARSLAQEENEFTRNSSIQCFEFTLELVWKTLKRVAELYGQQPANAREAFRSGVSIKVIDDPQVWFEFIELRNRSAHIYKEQVAKEIYQRLNDFARLTDTVIENLKKVR